MRILVQFYALIVLWSWIIRTRVKLGWKETLFKNSSEWETRKRLLSFDFGEGVKGLGKEKLDSWGIDEEEGGWGILGKY